MALGQCHCLHPGSGARESLGLLDCPVLVIDTGYDEYVVLTGDDGAGAVRALLHKDDARRHRTGVDSRCSKSGAGAMSSQGSSWLLPSGSVASRRHKQHRHQVGGVKG